MKKNLYTTPKKDFKFIVLMTISVIVFVVGSLLVGSISDEVEITPTPLPDEGAINIDKVVISEIVSNNSGVFVNNDGRVCDYIEIYNGSNTSKDLTGYGLSDKKNEIKWSFPNGTIIEANGYLVISLIGEKVDGLNANFKLASKGGEDLTLTNSNKKIIDAVTTTALSKNQSMSRDCNGNWQVYEFATPGFDNSKEGLDKYLLSLNGDESDEIVISELLASNKGNFKNEFGQLVGYVEVVNISNKSINLSDYYVSNDETCPFKYRFGDITLKPGEVYGIYATNATSTNKNVTGFSFDNKTGCVLLSKNGKIVQKLQYEGLTNGLAYIRNSSGKYEASNALSFGFPNNIQGIAKFQDKYLTKPQDLIINELMNNNHIVLAQNTGNYYDWVELYNNSSKPIELSEYSLSNSDNQLIAYKLPEITLNPGEYYIVMCSGDTNLSNQSYKHAGFKIGENESLYLNKGNELIDSVYVANVPANYSYGRNDGNGFYYIAKPTPGEKNETGNQVVSLKPVFQTVSGIYNNVSKVEVKIEGNGTIYYTTDGSIPTTSSKVYTGPIVLNKTTAIHARVYNDGEIMSSTVSSSYIINENHTLPVMSVSMSDNGFMAMQANEYSTVERQCFAEFWEDNGSFSVGCSISLVGGNTRHHEKKSYCLRFDSDWGVSNLVYPMFDSRDNSVYDALVLRTGSNDWDKAVIRDTLATSLVDEYTDLDVQAYKYCILYINGQYYGIYNIREKVNAKFITMHYNIAKSAINLFRIDGEISSGSKQGYTDIVNYAKTHDLSIKSNYDYVCSKVDINNLIDYWICEMYPYNPDVYNVRYFNSPLLDDGKWKYVYYDLDCGFRSYNSVKNYYTEYLVNPKGMTGFINNTYDNTLPRKLFVNEEFEDLFLQRLNYHLRNTFSKENVQGRYDFLKNLLQNEIVRDRNRWQNATMSNYNTNMNSIQSFINTRTNNLLKQTKSFFKLSDNQMKEYFGDLW